MSYDPRISKPSRVLAILFVRKVKCLHLYQSIELSVPVFSLQGRVNDEDKSNIFDNANALQKVVKTEYYYAKTLKYVSY